MLKFIPFGSGSCGNCYYIFSDTCGIIIDQGIGIRAFKKHFDTYGLSLNSVKAILLTHDHADHVKTVGVVSSLLNIPVYATNPIFEGVRRNYVVHKKIDPANEKIIEKDQSFAIDDFKITPFSVPHDSMDCIGYMIEYEDVKFCLMTDVGHFTEEMEAFIKSANYLVVEANYDSEMLKRGNYPLFLKERITSGRGHSSNDTCAEVLSANISDSLKHVWLCHLSEENNHPELARTIVEAKLQDAGFNVGTDFHMTVLKRKTPTGVFTLKP